MRNTGADAAAKAVNFTSVTNLSIDHTTTGRHAPRKEAMIDLMKEIDLKDRQRLENLREAAKTMLANHKAFEELDIQEKANICGRALVHEYEGLLTELQHVQDYEDEDGPTRQAPRTESEIEEDLHRCLDIRVIQTVEILLTTGGPACRIILEDVERGRTGAKYQFQDWWQPWTTAQLTAAEQDTLDDVVERIAGPLMDELEYNYNRNRNR